MLRLLNKLPLPKGVRLDWQRRLLDRAYWRDITAARSTNDTAKVESLSEEHRFELDVLTEEEDEYVTGELLIQARRYRISVPRIYNNDGSANSTYWEEAHHSRAFHLTNEGIALIRDQLYRERKSRHELRLAWLPPLTGLIGAITGLLAVLAQL